MKYLFCRSLFVIFLFLITSAYCSAEPVKIGVTLSLTGKYKLMGMMKKNAYMLWQKDVNKRGGLLGREVELIIHNDESEPQKAKALYQQLITEEKVELILGPYSSGITEAVLPITEKYRFPLLASGAAADRLWQNGYTYFFGVYIPTSRYTAGFMELMLRNEMTDVAIVFADDPFSIGIAEGAKKWALRFGMNVVLFEEFKKGTKDLKYLAEKVRDLAPQTLVMGGHLNESVDMRLALKNINWLPRAYYASSGPVAPEYHNILKSDANLTFSSSQWEPHKGSVFPGAEKFTEDFIDNFSMRPTYHASSAYAAGQILETAIKNAGNFNRDEIRDVLASLDTMTIMGRYGVDSTGVQIRHISLIIQWQDGVKQILAPEELKTSTVKFHETGTF